MKVLSLSLDGSVLNKDSKTAKRAIEYGGLVARYDVIVSNDKDIELELSDSVNVFGVKGVNKIVTLFRGYVLANKLIVKEKYDVISVQDTYYLAILAWILARKNSIGLEVQVRGFEKFKGVRKMIAFFVIPKADSVKTISERLKKMLLSDFKVDEKKIIIAPIFTPVKHDGYVNKLDNQKKIIFITVGRLVAVKNIEMQIVAMNELAKDYDNIELWIAGSGDLEKALEIKSRNLEVFDRVKFLGWREDTNDLYKQADVFLLTSDSEGWAKVVIEAASFGLPIIMTDVGCAGEVIKNNESGIVIPVRDKEALKIAMKDLINNPSKRKELGENAREAVQKRPSREEINNLYLKSWQTATKKRR